VTLDVGDIAYDMLVVAGGVTHSYFGHDEWEAAAPGLKTVEDATSIRSHILEAFEKAERANSSTERDRLLTFVVIGGGPTGVELAGTLIEIARHTLKADFRRINPANARVILIEAGERVLSTFSPDLSDRARSSLSELGVDVQTRTRVTDVARGQITIARDSGSSTVFAETILWAAGVKGSSLGQAVQKATGAELDRAGRVIVEPDFSVSGHPDIFVIGDLADYRHAGEPLPGVAPAAMQAGDYVARVISARLQNRAQPVFHYRDKGSMATIGRAAAVASVGGWKFSGLPAWLLWLFIHLLYLVQFQNRLLVLIQWAWNYMTFNRSARLITTTEHRTSVEISDETDQARPENLRNNLLNKFS
jgi:NADH dehydrogenase